jgi:membrane protein required for colicin V production
MPALNWLDFILAAFLALCFLSSARKGFAREIIGLASTILALVLGMWLYGTAGLLVEPLTGPGHLANFLGFLIVVVAVLTAGAIVGWIVKRFLHVVGLSFFDRLMGAIFGLARGALIAAALLTAWMAFGSRAEGQTAPATVLNSKIAPYLLEASRVFVSIAPMDLKAGFRKQYEQVKAATVDRAAGGVRAKGPDKQ